MESLKCQGKKFIIHTVRRKVLMRGFELLKGVVKVILEGGSSRGGVLQNRLWTGWQSQRTFLSQF